MEIPQVKYRDIKPDEDLYEVMGMGSSKKDARARLWTTRINTIFELIFLVYPKGT